MTQRITGFQRPISYNRKREHLYNARHQTGAYNIGLTGTGHSTITLWVPKPGDLNHSPGIFLRLQNPTGTAYTRISPLELESLVSFLTAQVMPATAAYLEAENFIHYLQDQSHYYDPHSTPKTNQEPLDNAGNPAFNNVNVDWVNHSQEESVKHPIEAGEESPVPPQEPPDGGQGGDDVLP